MTKSWGVLGLVCAAAPSPGQASVMDAIALGQAPVVRALHPGKSGELLLEHHERLSDGARVFVLARSSKARLTIEERLDFSLSARAAIEQVLARVPDRAEEVKARQSTPEFILMNLSTGPDSGIALFQRAPRWEDYAALDSSSKVKSELKSSGIPGCPPSMADGNGFAPQFVNQEMTVSGQYQSMSGIFYEFEVSWRAVEVPGGGLTWQTVTSNCSQIDNPIPPAPTPPAAGSGSSGSSGSGGGFVLGGGAPGGGIPSVYYLPPSYVCWPDPDGVIGVVCTTN
jgi:uncharacterized membrane protein YgcG